MNLFLQVLSFLLQAVSFLCKFCLLKGQNSQKTDLVIEKTKLARACNTTSVFCDCKLSFLLQAQSYADFGLSKDKTCKRKTQLVIQPLSLVIASCVIFSYKLCLL